MAGDGRGEAGAGGLALADALGQMRIKLPDIVRGPRWHPVRHPAVFRRNRKVGQLLDLALRALQLQLLPLHRGARGGGERQVALVAVDLEKELGATCHTAADLERYDGAIPDNPVDDELVGRSLGDHLAGSLQWDAVALAHRESGQLAEFSQAVA